MSGDADREGEDAPVERGLQVDDGRTAREHAEQQIASPGGDEQAEPAADGREQQGFGEQLTDHAATTGADRQANGHLPVACVRA